MATILIASLFLPNTVSFTAASSKEEGIKPTVSLHQRSQSAAQLKTKAGQLALTNDKIDQLDLAFRPTLDKFLFTPPPDLGEDDTQHKFPQPRGLARNEGNVPEWGRPVLNQPHSRAEPLPPASIHDFVLAREGQKYAPIASKRQVEETTPMSTRAPSPVRNYEEASWTVVPAIHGNGGLVNAIRQIQDEASDLSITWIGTIGSHTDAFSDSLKNDIIDKFLNNHQSEVVFCSDKDFDGQYAHYCKTILWPIFHYQVPDHIKSRAYADHSWEFYRSVNRHFADKIIACYKRGDTIWVHDYHLLLVPLMVREKFADAKIGFFLHVGFPSSEIFRCLAKRKELLEGMLGADLIVFQIAEYATHFLQTCGRILTVETTADGVQLKDRFVNVTEHAIGINPPLFEEARHGPRVDECIKDISERFKGKRIMVARDKLDYMHGIRQKLMAFERFLDEYPKWADDVVLIQVATNSHESDILSQVSEIVSRIECAYSTLTHSPLLFLRQDLPFPAYIALLTLADVLVVSSTRDGMNLTPHDFIYLQDGKGGTKKHGPLILSESAGCATVFGEQPIKINPWDYKMQAKAMNQALEMSDEEKASRWTQLHDMIIQHTGLTWFKHINAALTRACDEHQQRSHASVPRLSFVELGEKYKTSDRRLFILDYEGTLAPHKTGSGVALGSPERVRQTLSNLMVDPKNIVYIMSGHDPHELESVFRTLPAVGLIAENGCFLREFGQDSLNWIRFDKSEDVKKWKSEVRNMLEYWRERIEESYIEDRLCSLIFHYEKSTDQEAATRQAGECIEQINGSCKSMRVRAVPIDKAVLIESEDFSKCTAASHVFTELHDSSKGFSAPDFMMVVGNDREDEVVFRWANEKGKEDLVKNVFTVTVSTRNTEARASLTQGSTGLRTTLQRLANISAELAPRDYFNVPFQRNQSFSG